MMPDSVPVRYTQIPHQGHVRPTASLPPTWNATQLPHRNIHIRSTRGELKVIQSLLSPVQHLRRKIRRAGCLPSRRARRGRGLGHRPRAVGPDLGKPEWRGGSTHRACYRRGIGYRGSAPARWQVTPLPVGLRAFHEIQELIVVRPRPFRTHFRIRRRLIFQGRELFALEG